MRKSEKERESKESSHVHENRGCHAVRTARVKVAATADTCTNGLSDRYKCTHNWWILAREDKKIHCVLDVAWCLYWMLEYFGRSKSRTRKEERKRQSKSNF